MDGITAVRRSLSGTNWIHLQNILDKQFIASYTVYVMVIQYRTIGDDKTWRS